MPHATNSPNGAPKGAGGAIKSAGSAIKAARARPPLGSRSGGRGTTDEAAEEVRPTRASQPPKAGHRPESSPPARTRGRPRGPFPQHRRLDALRALLQRHPKGLTIYELARELDLTPRSLRRYLGEVKREIDLISSVDKPGGARLWRLAPSEVPR